MRYPEEIIPKPGYHIPFPFDKLEGKASNFILCYRIEGSIEENLEPGAFAGMRKLKKCCFEHVPHMSMNLMGGDFMPAHVRFVQHKPASNDWDGTNLILIEEYIGNITESDKAHPIYYHANTLCQEQVKTSITFNNKDAYNAMKKLYAGIDLPDYSSNIVTELPTEIRIVHKPTNTNYWHVQMEVYPPYSQQEFKNDSAIWRERIFEQIRDNILRYRYEQDVDIEYKIPKDLYIDF